MRHAETESQKWGATCAHKNVAEIKNGYDETIGGQCSTCLEVLWGVGKCGGCHKQDAKLTVFVAAHGERFCGDTCRRAFLERKKQAKPRAKKSAA